MPPWSLPITFGLNPSVFPICADAAPGQVTKDPEESILEIAPLLGQNSQLSKVGPLVMGFQTLVDCLLGRAWLLAWFMSCIPLFVAVCRSISNQNWVDFASHFIHGSVHCS